jgi:polyisoprenoid-binding protein YceI
MIRIFLLLIFNIGINFQTIAQWNQVQKSSITFKIKNAGIWAKGSFSLASVKVNIDEANPTQSAFSGIVESKSIQTGIKLRDNHLRDKESFFDVGKYPTLSMKSVSVSINNPGVYTVKWSLTIKGITRRFSSEVQTLREGNELTIFTLFTINRNDWNIGGQSFTLGDFVSIKLSTSVLRQ